MHVALLSAANSVHTQKIANALCERGYRVTLFSLPNHADQDNAYDKSIQIKYLHTPGIKGYIFNAGELRRLLLQDDIDILNAHYASGYGTLAGGIGFRPYVLSVWGSDVYDFPYEGWIKRALLKRNLRKADLLLSTSQCMAGQTEKFVRDKEIIVTPFGVDTTIFAPLDASTHEEIRIGFIKGVSEKYGIEYLIRAFGKAIRACVNQKLHLYVYGDGNQMEAMESLVDELKITANVTFYGRIPHTAVPSALNKMDIFCVPSTLDSESFGVSAVEAMACGIPCITSDVAGLSEVMVNGETGYIVPRKDVDALADKIIELVMNPQMRTIMGKNGRKRVMQYYEWNKCVDKIIGAYKKITS